MILGDDGVYSFIDFIRELLRNDEFCSSQLRHLQFHMVVSPCLSGFSAPLLRNVSPNGIVYTERLSYRLSQRLVEKAGLYETDKMRTDDEMVEVELENSKYTWTEHVPIWFSKTRTFLIFGKSALNSAAHLTNNNKEDNIKKSDDENCFAQYFNVLRKKMLT